MKASFKFSSGHIDTISYCSRLVCQ